MSFVSLNDLSFYGLMWTFKSLPFNTQRLAYGFVGHSPLIFVTAYGLSGQ
jgi:hypothetical protein